MHMLYIVYTFMILKHLYLIMSDYIPSQLVKTFSSNTLKIKVQTGLEWHNILQLS